MYRYGIVGFMTARYRQIADDLRRRIETGQYKPGTKLPVYAELTEIYDTGRSVIRAALAVLQEEGLVQVRGRGGTVVRPRTTRRRVQRGSVVHRDDGGYVFPAWRPGEAWQVHGRPRASIEPIPARPAELLGLDEGTPVLRRRRITSPVGEPPFQIADTWIHPTAVADAPQVGEIHTGPGGYLDRLEEAGHGPISWREIKRVRLPSVEEARLLGIPRSVPVLEVARLDLSAESRQPLAVTVCVIPGDRFEEVTELRRDKSARWPR